MMFSKPEFRHGINEVAWRKGAILNVAGWALTVTGIGSIVWGITTSSETVSSVPCAQGQECYHPHQEDAQLAAIALGLCMAGVGSAAGLTSVIVKGNAIDRDNGEPSLIDLEELEHFEIKEDQIYVYRKLLKAPKNIEGQDI